MKLSPKISKIFIIAIILSATALFAYKWIGRIASPSGEITALNTTLFGGLGGDKRTDLRFPDGAMQMAAATGTGASLTNQSFDKSGTFTTPAGVTQIMVEAWGGGGGGGGGGTTAPPSNSGGGGGGGGGGYAKKILTVTPRASYAIVVGTGGAGGGGAPPNGHGSRGGSGGTSSFNSKDGRLVYANGGSYGWGSRSEGASGGRGGVGGSTGAGDTFIVGKDGLRGQNPRGIYVGGAGGEGGTGGNGGVGGEGAGHGNGRLSCCNYSPAKVGSAPGGGGGGGGINGSGASGASGRIIVWYYSLTTSNKPSEKIIENNVVSTTPSNQPSERTENVVPASSPKESPFGASGAFARPSSILANTPSTEIQKLLMEAKDPYRYVQDIGIKWVRPGMDISWATVQSSPADIEGGIYDWRIIDNFYGRVPEGVNVLATFGPGKQGMQPRTWQFINKPIEDSYLKFVERLVERYDGDGIDDMPGLRNPIHYWQIENEPASFYGPNSDWQGFSHLVEISYKAIKKNNPQDKIVLAGMAGGPEEVTVFYPQLLKALGGKYFDVFDIHTYTASWKELKKAYDLFRNHLNQNGFANAEIWYTETAVQSTPFDTQHTEKAQAISLAERYIYALSFGAKKVFWWNIMEGEGGHIGVEDLAANLFGLVYDGIGKSDPGYGIKKLSYYTYKKMVEILDGSDWNNIQTIQESNGVYVYKFTKQGKPIWVAWNDNATEKQTTISGISLSQVKITEAVPKYTSGKEVTDYATAFNTETKSVSGNQITLTLKDKPVFVE